MTIVKPFLRWAGGKSWLLKHIDKYLPTCFENYHEPFLGGGAMYFYLKANGYIGNEAYLSDLNEDLITTYQVIKENVENLILLLKEHYNTKEEYYRIRELKFNTDVEIAAQFLFLNKTSFNGLYRVNQKGKYNVPYGYRKLGDVMYDYDSLYYASELMKDTYLSVKDFKEVKMNIKSRDLVYFDPPYTVAHENNGFIQYNQSIFSWENQVQLSDLLEYTDYVGAKFILSNAYHKNIVELYGLKGRLHKISRPSTIGGIGAKRKKYNEIIVSNVKSKKRKK